MNERNLSNHLAETRQLRLVRSNGRKSEIVKLTEAINKLIKLLERQNLR